MSDLVFLPWARRGFARAISATRNSADRANAAITFGVKLAADAGGAVETTARLIGPGDVVGIDALQIAKTDPLPNKFDFESNYLASIDFKAPDLPWMFTPWTHDSHRLEPWIALIVLEKGPDDIVRSDPTRPLPYVTIDSLAELPDLAQSWAWAHVQVSGAASQAEARAKLESTPAACLSRLICPRRLEARQTYVACVVPAFEVGRKAGLGMPLTDADLTGADSTRFAWTMTPASPTPFELPVYYSWEFGTGDGGDFEALVLALQRPSLATPQTATPLGRRAMNVVPPPSWPAVSAEPPPAFFEGALQPVGAAAQAAPAIAGFTPRLVDALDTQIPGAANAGDVELPLPPPLYGRWHAARSRVPAVGATKAWLRTLNLDLGLRAAAGLGARIVQEQQESLMAAAWRQVGEIERANQLLRQGQLARSASDALYASRFEAMAAATLLHLAAPVAARIADRWSPDAEANKTPKETLAAHVRASAVAGIVLSPQFRLATRARGPLARRFGRAGTWTGSVIRRWNDGAITPDTGRVRPPGTITTDDVTRTGGDQPRICELSPSRLATRRGAAFGPVETIRVQVSAFMQSLPETLDAVAPYAELSGIVTRFSRAAAELQRAIVPAPPEWRAALLALRHLIEMQGALSAALSRAILDPATAADIRARIDALRRWAAETFFAAPTPAESLELQRQFLLDIALVEAQGGMPPCVIAPPPRPPLDLAHIGRVLLARIDPTRTIAARVKARIGMGGRTFAFHTRADGDELEPVMAAPRFDFPMYKALVELSPHYLLPGLEGVARNSIGLLQSNRRFIEAFMTGLNHEMASELLWREFPTDQRGTYFRFFWDSALAAQPAPDVEDLSEWTGPLGENRPALAAANPAVLLVRGDLTSRFPRVLIYLQKAAWTNDGGAARRTLGVDTINPTFSGLLSADVSFLGFSALEGSDLIGSADSAANDPGYFIVLQEPIGELRFGLNETPRAQPENTWRDLSWPDVAVTNNHIDLGGAPPAPPADTHGAAFGPASDAAQLAFILLQRPLRLAVHASDLLLGEAP